jgi:hypothetical protein
MIHVRFFTVETLGLWWRPIFNKRGKELGERSFLYHSWSAIMVSVKPKECSSSAV